MDPYIIQSDGTEKPFEPQNKYNIKLLELQAAVDGYIELVYLDNDIVMVVNEEGLIRKLPVNHKASAMANNVIVGDVLIISQDLLE